MIRFFVERETRDLLFVFWSPGHEQHLEGCALCIAGDPSSICWTQVSEQYLARKCVRVSVAKAKRHPQWEAGNGFSMRVDWMSTTIAKDGVAVLPYPPS